MSAMEESATKPLPEICDDDPRLEEPSPVVREGDFVILAFGDGRQVFAQCLKNSKGKAPSVKVNKRSYSTANLVGLAYGTVLEVGLTSLSPLPDGEEIIPSNAYVAGNAVATVATTDIIDESGKRSATPVDEVDDTTFPPIEQSNDNRHLIDTNKSQAMDQDDILKLRLSGTDGVTIVDKLIENSSSFSKKTEFSKAKYILKKQMKYQPRCRMVRCTAYTICEAMYLKDPRKLMNLREDTLGQILSYSNISAGCQALVFEACMGIVTGAVAERMGGYGRVMSVYTGQQPAYLELMTRFNLSFAANHSIKWVHSGDVFHAEDQQVDAAQPNNEPEHDPELAERQQLEWPCPLQDHTRAYLQSMKSDREKSEFLAKRCARFARKLTRHTTMEANQWLAERKCDSVIIVTRYDPTPTLLGLLPYLAPSSPFVVYCEFVEPLTECFRELQRQSLAINLRLSDTWMREYQVLPGRTHPNMNISQSGGFILTGIKLCEVSGKNEIDDSLMKEIRSIIGGRRGRKPKSKNNPPNAEDIAHDRKRKAEGGREAKRPRN
jgi:tRNA (adenine58-N1)-methyltransferase non-catalytic subunit